MKTFIVLCCLATIVFAIPTPLREHFNGIDFSLENFPDKKVREKKSPLQDPSQELPHDNGQENTQSRHSLKTEFTTSAPRKIKVVHMKPMVIKKKFGYHVYRDSDEEMAHADPNENCRKQFKVKLCDNELLLHTHSNSAKRVLSEQSDEIVSDKEMENSLKIAKEAVENLERGLQNMEHNSAKKSNSKENYESDIKLQQDIEMAKSALEHIQRSMGNLESIDIHLNDPEIKETQHLKSINQWKDAIDSIHKNVETGKNIEDAFVVDKQDLNLSENINVPKMNENENSADQEIKKYDSKNENTPQTSFLSTKTVYGDKDLEHNTKPKTSSTKDEQDMNVENDMFISPTDNKESIMKLHSDSLTSENVFDEKTFNNHDTNKLSLNTDDHLKMKNVEILAKDTDFQEMQPNTDKQEFNAKAVESVTMATLKQNNKNNEDSGLAVENSALNTLTKNNNIDTMAAKSTENVENIKLKEESHTSSVTEQNNNNHEHLSKESSDVDNIHLSHPKMTLLKEKEAKGDNQNVLLALDNNPLHAKVNVINNEEHDMTTKSFKSQVPQENHQNIHTSSLAAVEPREEQHISNDFSNMRLAEYHNTNHLGNENHGIQDFDLKHMTQEEEQMSSRMDKDSNIEEQLNEFHESFMRLAQEKQLNDILLQQLKNAEHLNARMQENHNNGPQLHVNRGFKSATEFHNDHLLPTISKTNGLRNGKTILSGPTSMRHTEGQPVSEFHNEEMFLTPTRSNGFLSELHTHKEHMNMRIPENHNIGQLFTDSHELHDPNPSHWAQEKQHNDDLAQIFNSETEFHNEPHLNGHLHEFVPTNRFHNNFNLDNNHDGYPMRSRTPDHFHIMKHAKSNDMDSSMQPSMHIPMRDSNIQWGHHHHHPHHGMMRSSYAPSQSNVGPTSGTVGVFSNTNGGTGCGIPLLVSCSPSVVSGSLARAQPVGASAPTYRTGENLMYYMKRDANKSEGRQNVKIQKS